ncbi:hypothetical protein HPB50_029609 [Hyalomma asiaticum]|nr:hypothetical protein HPB50_029609 [Hyalomma asiaticum]
MAQPTGLESAELNQEDGTTPRRSSSPESEATIVENLLTSLESSTVASATKKQLVDELRARGLSCSGRKDDLVERLIRDNVSRRATASMGASTSIQAADDDDRQAHLETLSADNARLRTELDILRAELSRTSTSYSREAPHESSPRVRRLGEQLTSSDHGPHVPTDATRSGSAQSSMVGATNHKEERHRTTNVPTQGSPNAEPSMAQILAALVKTQVLLANSLSRGPPAASPIQIHSSSDTSSSIPIFDGSLQESAHRWIAQVERIAALTHWTSSLTLASAASRLAGSARDWHSTYGWRYETWEEWRDALTQQFRRRLTMQEFIELQSKRRLQNNETIVEYMYSKNAVLDKAPYRLAEEEHISLILSGIDDNTWANPLAAQLCVSVTELIDRAALLDAKRPYAPKTTRRHRRQQCTVGSVPLDPCQTTPASGANISIISTRALPDDVPTHTWVSSDEIEVLDRSIRPTLAANLHIGLGNTNVLLEDIVVAELPNGIDVILGSDWRRTPNVDKSGLPQREPRSSVRPRPRRPGAIDANSAPWAAFISTRAKQRQRRADELFAQQRTGNFASTSLVHAIVFQLRRHRSSVPRVQQAQSTGNYPRGRTTLGERQREPRNWDIQASKLLSAFDGRHTTGRDRLCNKRPFRFCIDSGANISIISARALPDDVPTHTWVSRDEIEVLDRSIRPTRAANLHIGLGNTNVLLEDIVVAELPNGIDVILGSDWRRTPNVDVTFHTTNDVTIVPVEPAEGTSTHEATPTKRGTARRTGEALIASFCRQGNKHVPRKTAS